jgi:23S rRNA pseudouridine2605 synthase
MSKVRIQKVLAGAGVSSRRAAETMILEGRVEVNRRIVRELPCFVDVEADEIRVDGEVLRRPKMRKTYFLLNKPKGVVCAQADPHARLRVFDIVPPLTGQTYCIGGLDVDSTGLVLLTNDGELIQRLSHPRYGVTRRYLAEVDGKVGEGTIEQFKAGVFMGRQRSARAKVKVLRRGAEQTLIEIELAETSGREVRQVLARLGHKTRRLKRVGIGPLSDEGITIGRFRRLSPHEVAALMRAGGKGKTTERKKGDG